MFTFKQLFEAKDAGGHGSEKHHVMSFARMNPPTTGHMEVINKLHAVADQHKAGHSLIVSHSQDAKKNPLSAEQKIKHINRYSPQTNVKAASKESPTILHHAAELHKQGVEHLHVVAGSDRHKEMHDLLHKYNTGEEHKHGSFKFKSITMHSSGERDPDSEGTSGMSGTKMREHAHAGNFAEFRKGVPSHVSDKHAHELMKDVRHGSGIKEEAISYSTFMEARMSAAVKLQRAFEREQQKSAASRERAKELLAPKKPEPVKEETIDETIVKVDSGYEVHSEKGKNLGGSPTLAGAKKRLRQVEYFKHVKEDMEFEDSIDESVHDNRTGFAKKKREDDEGGELYRHTYKYNVSKPGVNDGKKHERHVTTPLTTRKKHELEHLARAHITKQGYKIHEETMAEEEKRGAYKQKSPVVIAPKDPKAKTYGKIVSKIRTMGEEIELDESMADSWKSVQSMDKGSVTGGKHEVKKRLAYLNAVHAHHKKFGNDTHKVRKEIEGINRSRIAEETEIQENQMGLKSFITLVKEGTLQSSGDDSIPTLTGAPAKEKKKAEENLEEKLTVGGGAPVKQANGVVSNRAPVAPTIDRKYIKGTPEHKAHKEKSKPINGHPTGKYNEEVEVIDEGLDPSEIASNPRMYSADSAKKAYYHKKASASDKESLARHLDRHHGNKEWRKPVKEETESIEEGYAKVETKKYSWGTMKTAHHGASFSVPMHPEHHKAIHGLKDQQEHKFKTEDGRHWTAKRQGDDVHLHSANDGPKTKIKHSDLKEELVGNQVKLDKNKNGKLDADDFKKLRKEEAEQIEEANHREFASQGKMHPDMAKHMKAGHEMDFYHSKTGDKVSGVVKHVSPSEVHIKAHKDGKMGAGEVHKFKVTSKLDEAKINAMTPDQKDKPVAPKNKKPAVESDLVNAAGDKPHEEKFETVKKESFSVAQLFQALKEGMWPGTPEYKAKYDGAKQGGGSGIKKGTRYGGSLQKDEPDHDDDAPKAGRPTGAKSGARKNLGNSKLHK